MSIYGHGNARESLNSMKASRIKLADRSHIWPLVLAAEMENLFTIGFSATLNKAEIQAWMRDPGQPFKPNIVRPVLMSHKLRELVHSKALTRKEHQQLARRIYHTTLKCASTIRDGNFEQITDADIEFVFKAIDDLYFEGQVRRHVHDAGLPLAFRVSKRMTNAGGTTKMTTPPNRPKHREFEIAISSTLLFHSFNEGAGAATIVTGIPCVDRLEALQRIMEHEMLHLVELLVWDDSNCSAARFRGFAKRLFGHSQSNHQLLRPRDIARRDHDIGTGDWVTFSHQGQRFCGIVNRITKRATVLVPDKSGIPYSDGRRYSKYYVPYELLKKRSA